MNPLLVVAIPLVLVILGMILNNIGLAYDQPPSSTEQDPTKRLVAEKEAYRKFFDMQRSRSLKRQKRVSQYCWLLIVSIAAAFIWLYTDTVNKTTRSTQVAAMQTVATEEGKHMVLAMTLSDGSNLKYLIKIPEQIIQPPSIAPATAATELATEKISNWELERLGSALSLGKNPLPTGIVLKISPAAMTAQ
jgi:hypothetical protein